MKATALAVLLMPALFTLPVQAQAISGDAVKIGVLTDMSGPYAALAGEGSVAAARMAAKDFSADGTVLGKKIEIVSADHQNKPDIASVIARNWFDNDGVDAVVDLVSTAVALSVMELAAQKDRITLVSGSSAQAITNENCTPTTVHWNYPIYARTSMVPESLVKAGKKSWFFITGDYGAAKAIEADATRAILANGGKVLGSARHPLGTADFSSLLLSAQASGADVIALSNAGADTVNAIKQAKEFGITGKSQMVLPMVVFLTDTQAVGLSGMQGLQFVDPFYWEQSERSRAWAQRYFAQTKRMPTSVQASVYSSTLNYLKAVAAAGTDRAADVMKQLKGMTIDDGLFKGTVRADGSVAFDEYLVEVKAPSASKGEGDFYTIREVIPAARAGYPLANSTCKFLKN